MFKFGCLDPEVVPDVGGTSKNPFSTADPDDGRRFRRRFDEADQQRKSKETKVMAWRAPLPLPKGEITIRVNLIQFIFLTLFF